MTDEPDLSAAVNRARRRRLRLGGFRCSRCGEWKPAEAFHRDVTKPNGLRSVCRECRRWPTPGPVHK